mmetsp:Transcript_51561/g.167386  ORF Transcript_51561/g.167386 Transcript_51561/m.167386 type:complete len:381 (-) Transcript_51561:109-1251(-)
MARLAAMTLTFAISQASLLPLGHAIESNCARSASSRRLGGPRGEQALAQRSGRRVLAMLAIAATAGGLCLSARRRLAASRRLGHGAKLCSAAADVAANARANDRADLGAVKVRSDEGCRTSAPEEGRTSADNASDCTSSAAPWMQSLKKALNHGGTKRPKRDRSEAKRKHVQLATVDPASGRPSVRTVSFRGFMPSLVADGAGGGGTHEETCMLMFVTDLRAEKVRHVRQAESGGSAYAECCWWLDEAGVQFRIAGRAVLATADSSEPELRAACEVVWDRLKEQTRTTFTWPTPGAPVAGADDNSSGPTVSQGSPIRLADANFGLLVVIPEFVDELRLGGNQRRLRYALEGAPTSSARGGTSVWSPWHPSSSWTVEEVNP